jgi:simple sugar transport system ATP-binding protein
VSTAVALALRGMSKRFGMVQALDGAELEVPRGAIVSLLGENGAGKTTLLRIAYGMVRPDAGTVMVDGRPASPGSPAGAIRLGLGMVHQHFALVPALTAAENVALGGRGWFSAQATAARMREVTARTGLAVEADAPAGSMPTGAQQRLEIIKALARGARTLILDEPTAVLTPAESVELLAFLREFAHDGGAVVLITHKLREALGVADVVTVMRRGRTVLVASRGEASEESVARAMLGDGTWSAGRRELFGSRVPHPVDPNAPAIAEVKNIVITGARGDPVVRGVSAAARSGEILGIAGVEGSGVHELVRALAGRIDPEEGEVRLPEEIGFVPEDRVRDALVPEWSLAENVALKGAGRATGRVDWTLVRKRTDVMLHRFDVRASGPAVAARTLSGGNQQKLVLARELATEPPLLVVEQPTRGLDIAASAAIHDQLVAARDRGAAVVIASADLDELLMLADRVLVMFDGRAREVARERDVVGRAMLGLGESAEGTG